MCARVCVHAQARVCYCVCVCGIGLTITSKPQALGSQPSIFSTKPNLVARSVSERVRACVVDKGSDQRAFREALR